MKNYRTMLLLYRSKSLTPIYLSILVLLFGCENNTQNEWVQKVLYFDNHQLRTYFIFHPIQEVKTIEKLPLKFEDEAGLAYQMYLDSNTVAEIYYYKNIEDTTHKIVAFAANIHFTQEKQAIEMYKSFENHFQKLYGVFDGTFGNQEWIIPDMNYRITLKLQNQKKEILITCSSIS